MKEFGCAENSAVDSVVSTLSMEDLEKAANKAGLEVEHSVLGCLHPRLPRITRMLSSEVRRPNEWVPCILESLRLADPAPQSKQLRQLQPPRCHHASKSPSRPHSLPGSRGVLGAMLSGSRSPLRQLLRWRVSTKLLVTAASHNTVMAGTTRASSFARPFRDTLLAHTYWAPNSGKQIRGTAP